MENLIQNLQGWLKRNNYEDSSRHSSEHKRKERNWFGGEGKPKPKCIFCKGEHWSDECKTVVVQAERKKFFVDKNLCFNCGRSGHRGSQCRSRGCFKCGSKHHTSICDKNSNPDPKSNGVLHGYSRSPERNSLPAVVPVKIKGEVMWAYLDTGSSRNFVSRDAAKRLNLKPKHHEPREIVTLNGVSKQSIRYMESRSTP